MKVQRLFVSLGLAIALGAGCSPAAPQDVTVRWLLADGRSCIDAGVVRVSLTTSATSSTADPLSSPCPATPHVDGRIAVLALTPGVELRGSGLSGSGTVLYRGTLTFPDPVPPTADLILYFTGGQ